MITIKVMFKENIRRHSGVLTIFFLFACFYQLLVVNNRHPFIFLNTDGGNIASFAAARQNPESFKNDELLYDLGNIKHYQVLHVYILPVLKSIFGDYGSAFISMLWLHVFLQGIGFYLLGVLLFQDKVFSLLFSFTAFINVGIGFWDFWGIDSIPMPRVFFQACLPYLVLFAVKYKDNLKYWPFIIAFAGLLTYVHPVSAPAWGLAVILGFFFFLPPDMRLRKKLLFMFFIALVYSAVIFPFARNYLTSRQYGRTPDYQQVYQIISSRFMKHFADLPSGLKYFAFRPTTLFLSMASMISLVYCRNKRDKNIKLILIWAAAIFAMSVILPLIENAVCKRLNFIQVEYDLVRNIRFFIPIGIITAFWGIHNISEKLYLFGFDTLSKRRLLGILFFFAFLF